MNDGLGTITLRIISRLQWASDLTLSTMTRGNFRASTMTVEVDDKAQSYDVVVVGAGPAGTIVGRALATDGLSVLLIDRATFPRYKVCGCCLNSRALSALAAAGLGELSRDLGGVPLSQLEFCHGTARVALRLPRGMAVSRSALDAALVHSARSAGAEFIDGATVTALGMADCRREVRFTRAGRTETIRAKVVVLSTGLGASLLKGAVDTANIVRDGARIGAGTIAPPTNGYDPGVIHMAWSPGGYVGLVGIEDRTLNIAAAFDAAFTRESGGVGEAVRRILRECRMPEIRGLEEVDWRGTPPLTQHPSRVASERCFLVGDAAGYIEPFTGEGIAWALSSALALAPIVEHAATQWDQRFVDEWESALHRLLAHRHRVCTMVAWSLRHPFLVRTAASALSVAPSLASPVLRGLNTPAHHSPIG